MLVIHPDECIDCGVCEPECPIEAIQPDTVDGMEVWVDQNRKYADLWPNLTRKIPALPEAEDYKDKKNKYPADFSEKPGEGD